MIGALVGGALGLLGARSAGKSAESAAQTSADAQLAASQMAAEEARFRPVGITTRFGQSNFVIDPETGRLTSAGYNVSPDIAALRESLLTGAGGALGQAQGLDLSRIAGTAQGLFGLGSQFIPTSAQAKVSPLAQQFASQLGQYGQSFLPSSTTAAPSQEAQRYTDLLRQYSQQFLPERVSMEASPEALAQAQGLFGLQRQITPTAYDPTAAAQSYFAEQQAMLDPVRQREEQRLASSVFGRGRAGLSVGDVGQPELFTLAQARGQQDLALAAQARERARQEIQQDIGLGTSLGLQGLGTLQSAQEIARQRGLQDISTGLDLAGRGLTTEEQAQELARRRIAEDVGLGFNLIGQGIGAGEAATDLGRQRLAQDIALGTGLFGTGLGFLGQIPQLQTSAFSPFQTQLGLAQQLEAMGQQPLSLGAELGGGNAASAQALLQGGMGAAGMQLQGSLASSAARYGALQDLLGNQQIQQGIGGLFGNAGGQGYFGGIGSRATAPSSSIYSIYSPGARL
jgi:hypothetical protein